MTTFGITLTAFWNSPKFIRPRSSCSLFSKRPLRYSYPLNQQKWFALPEGQRESLKSYIVNVVIEYGAIENISRQMHNILSKANSVLVQIVKYEWNTTWTTFINDICSASLKDMNLCENNFSILKMLSE